MPSPNEQLKKIYGQEKTHEKRILKYAQVDLVKIYKNAFLDIRNEFNELYTRFLATQSQMAKYERLTKLEKYLADRIKKLTGETIKTTSTAILDNYEDSYYMIGYGHESALNMRMGFGLLDQKHVKAAIYNPVDRIKWDARLKDNAQLLNRRVREAITQGLVQGEAYEETVKRLARDDLKKQFLPELKKSLNDNLGKNMNEAMRIVRTEAHRARQAGKLLGYDKVRKIAEENDIEINRQWIATLGKGTRPAHASADGQLENKDGYFVLDNYQAGGKTLTKAPGLSGVAEHDIHCRCDTITAFKEIPYKVRRENIEEKKESPNKVRRENIEEKDVINYESFGTWAKEKGITKSKYGQKYNFY